MTIRESRYRKRIPRENMNRVQDFPVSFSTIYTTIILDTAILSILSGELSGKSVWIEFRLNSDI